MLSAETSVGKFPVKAVETMNNIIRKAESASDMCRKIEFDIPEDREENMFDAVNRARCEISLQTGTAAIIVLTHKGRTARQLSKFRPNARIIAVSDSFETMNNLCLKWGVTSLFHKKIKKEQMAIDELIPLILESGHASKGDLILFSAGAPYSDHSRLNWSKFVYL
jgi:pyruvate kinase